MTIAPIMQLLADDNAAPAGVLAAFGAIMCVALLIGIGIQCLICYFIIKLFKRVPPEFQKQNPNLVWLMLIPIFSIIWSFFVYPKLAQSYEAWAKATGHPEIGNAGGGMALALCICMCCCIIPYLGSCAALAALVLLIIFLVQINGLAAKIQGPAAPTTPTV